MMKPLFMKHLAVAPNILLGAPEVLTDVALLCVEERPYPLERREN
jgi:hypothetical protein